MGNCDLQYICMYNIIDKYMYLWEIATALGTPGNDLSTFVEGYVALFRVVHVLSIHIIVMQLHVVLTMVSSHHTLSYSCPPARVDSSQTELN